MRINETHILLLTLDDWIAAGLSTANFKQSKARGYIKATRACKGKPAEIEYESLPERFKEVIISKYGNPYEYIKKTALKQYLNADDEAFKFYSNLPEKRQLQLTEAAKWLNLALDLNQNKPTRQIAKEYTANKWNLFLSVAKTEGVKIPTSYAKFRKVLNQYTGRNYESLINKNTGNTFAQKITEEGLKFLVDHYSLPTKLTTERVWSMYNAEALKRDWKTLKDSKRVYTILHEPENVQKWYAGRHGYRKAAEKFGYALRTQLPTFRDALWYSDGTKLNFFYLDENNNMKADQTVYEIMDVYSEVMLGYAVGKTENHDLMYRAAKMAMQTSMAKPYEWRYDNQGGHAKLKNQGFLDKLSHLSIPTQPYNGKSKTIESAFGRFQQYVMRELWFFTGQNITAKSDESKANMEFILANKSRLPSHQEAIAAYVACREKWNKGLHFQYKQPKLDLYRTSVNPEARPVDYLDTIEMFWLTKERPITYYNHGITVQHLNEKYEYEVLENGLPDMNFRKDNVDRKFIVKFDPENMSHIRLYVETKQGLKFVAVAEPRLTVHRDIQSQVPGESELIHKLLDVRKQESERLKDSLPEVVFNDDHTLSIAAWQKRQSMATITTDEDDYTNYL